MTSTSYQDAVPRVIAAVEQYRTDPTARRLQGILLALGSAGASPVNPQDAGISIEWLTEQGEHIAKLTQSKLTQPGGRSAKDLLRLHNRLHKFGVSCAGWVVSRDEICQALADHARALYAEAVAKMSPYNGMQVFELWTDGYIPNFEVIAPGARDVVVGYAIRRLQWELDLMKDDDAGLEIVLEQIGKIITKLDEGMLAAFEHAGLPTSEADAKHAAAVCEVRGYWQRHLDGDQGFICLAGVYEAVFRDRTVVAKDIGTTQRAIQAALREWANQRTAQLRAGNLAPLHDLTYLRRWIRVTHLRLGTTAQEVREWEEAEARGNWAKAQAGDGNAAFHVVTHCESRPYSYLRTTGLHKAAAKARIAIIMEEHALALRAQIETAARPQWARQPFDALRDFVSLVRKLNDRAVRVTGAPLVDVSSWMMSQAEWSEYKRRYAHLPH